VKNPGQYEVLASDKVVWVNGDQGCLARLCKVSGEVFPHDTTPVQITAPEWDKWTALVRKVWGIEVGAQYRPAWTAPCAICGRSLGTRKAVPDGEGKPCHVACVRQDAGRG